MAKEFKVRGVPRLIVMKADGEVLNDNAVNTVTEMGPVIIEEWFEKC